MKKLLVYLKDYKKESILGPLFKLLEASFELLVPLVVTKIIDVGIATGDVHYIVRMVLLMVGLALIGLICSITAQYFAAKAAVGFAAGLKSALFRHIQSLSYSEMDHLGTASLITRMTSDVNQLQSGQPKRQHSLHRNSTFAFSCGERARSCSSAGFRRKSGTTYRNSGRASS